MKLPITIDPRYHDAVLFDLDGALTSNVPLFGATVDLARKLQGIGVAAAAYSSSPHCQQALKAAGIDDLFGVCIDGIAGERGTAEKPDPTVLLEATRRLGARPQRCVVVENSAAGVAAGRDGGFALVVGIDGTGRADDLTRSGADVVLADLADVAVRTGDKRISELPNALTSYGQLIGITSARESMLFLDYDGTLSPIVSDPAAATLVDGAAEALELVAAVCPVAILSGRDLADIRSRVGIPGIWYAGSHGFELTGPDGTYHQNEAAAAFVPLLERAAAELSRSLAAIPGFASSTSALPSRCTTARWHRSMSVRSSLPHINSAQRDGLRVTSGRMLVELRPDIDWDKGTTLAWIRDRIDPAGSLLPIYIGDDLTDEDAFDAVHFDGIGIVVGHDEDGDRKTAAHFTLQSPDQVREFIQRGSQWLAYKHQVSGEAWEYTFDGYDPQSEKLREALCTLGNGYFATRGAAPESKAGQVHYPGTYAAGVYNRLVDDVSGTEIDNESLVNLPNWLALTFRIDGGSWFDIDAVDVLSYRQTLDLRGAVLTREVRFRDDAGRTSSLTQRRFVAMHMPHVGALETTIVAEDWSGTIEIRSTLDGNVTNSLVERYRDLANEHLGSVDKREISDDSVLLTVQTTQSRIPVAMAARSTVWRDGESVPATYRLFDEARRNRPRHHRAAVSRRGGDGREDRHRLHGPRCRDVRTRRRRRALAQPTRPVRRAARRASDRMGASVGAAVHRIRRLRRRIADPAPASAASAADGVTEHRRPRRRGAGSRTARGGISRPHLLGRAVHLPGAQPAAADGHPVAARLPLPAPPEARHAAAAAGYSGAMFPWQSGSDGREESQRLHLNPRSGHWNPDASARAHHIGIAVAYNAWKFYQVTGDLAYLIDYGAEMLAEIARFFVSLATYDEERERFGIRGVIGPDEFHSGYPDAPYDGIDNNAYTNVMAVWVIMRAIDALNLLPLPNRLDLMEALGLNSDELAHWEDVSRRMYVPFHDGVISQFEGYGDLAELDWDRLRRQYGNIQRLDRILEAEHDDVNRYKASKQADALMLLYLLSATELRELLDRLGYRFTPEQVPEMVDYYLARTSHGSTLSGVVHTWVLARANRDRAMEFFQQALKSDVSDIQGGTTSEGIHLAAMAGTVDLMQRCFTGLETRSNRIILSPHWPEALGVLAITDPLPRSAPAPAGQRKGRDHQRGSTRRGRDRSGMPRSRRCS